jgi:hypothetical protein
MTGTARIKPVFAATRRVLEEKLPWPEMEQGTCLGVAGSLVKLAGILPQGGRAAGQYELPLG